MSPDLGLRDRWPLASHEGVREELLTAYADPSRGYHDLRHLTEVLDRLDELAGHHAFDPIAVRLAAWLHDGVYDGGAEAEERSARWAAEALADTPYADEVARLVRLTATHQPGPGDRDGEALSDADLAILASPPQRYAEYTAAVRKEYAHVSDLDFGAGRAAILSALLEGPSIFRTHYGREQWEAAARENLAREIRLLT